MLPRETFSYTMEINERQVIHEHPQKICDWQAPNTNSWNTIQLTIFEPYSFTE